MDTKLLKQKILDLAIRGKLVPQNPADEPASVLLERIKAEKAQLIKEGKIKKEKDLADNELPNIQLPSTWVWAKINDIFIYKGGYAFKSKDYSTSEINQVIRIGNVKNDCLLLNNQPVYVSDGIAQKAEDYKIQLGDLLFTMTGTKGKRDYFFTCLVEAKHIAHDLYLNQRVGCLRSISANVYLPYISLALKHNIVLDAIFATETGNVSQGNIGSNSTLNLYIPIPPLEEQKRIVTEIDRWFKCIDELDKNQQDLHTAIQQAKSKILDLAIHGKLVPQESEWKECTISELCENINGLWKGKKEPFINVGVIRNANFTKDFKLDYSKIEYIDVEEKSFKKRHLINGDLIVEKSGGSDQNPVGRAILYEGPDEKFSYSNFTMVLRINNAGILFYKYLYYFILNRYKCGDMKQMQTQTTGLHNLILDKYLAINVPLPQISEQKCIVSKIEELFAQLDKIEESLN